MATKLDNFDSPSLKEVMTRTTLAPIPAVAADLSTTNSWIYGAVICNPTAGAVTITIVDKTNGYNFMNASIPAGETEVVVIGFGCPMSGGINWLASAVGCFGYIAAFKTA